MDVRQAQGRNHQAESGSQGPSRSIHPEPRPNAGHKSRVWSCNEWDQLEEVIVTARKRQESILNVPVVETAIPRQQLQRFQVQDLKDISTMVPGLMLGDNVLSIGTQVSLHTAFTYLRAKDTTTDLPPNIEGGTPAPDAFINLRWTSANGRAASPATARSSWAATAPCGRRRPWAGRVCPATSARGLTPVPPCRCRSS